MALFETFYYLTKPYDKDPNPIDILETKYKNVDSLGDRFIVRGVLGANSIEGYRVYDSPKAFLEHMAAIPQACRQFHEVIMARKQKIKLDIDADVTKLDSIDVSPLCDTPPKDISAKYAIILDAIIDAMKTAFFVTFRRELTTHIVCESIYMDGRERQKYSNHIIIDSWYMSSNEQCAEFARQVQSYLPASIGKLIDMGVYKCPQNFRLVCNHKGDGRYKRIVGMDSDVMENQLKTLITYVHNCEALPDIVTVAAKQQQHVDMQLGEHDREEVMNICERSGVLAYNTLSHIRGQMIMFDRKSAEYCDICMREHTCDNSVFVAPTQHDGVMTVWRYCRRWLEDNKFNPLLAEMKAENRHRVRIGEFLSEVYAPMPIRGDDNIADPGNDFPMIRGALPNDNDIHPPEKMNFVDRRIQADLEKITKGLPLFPGMNGLFDKLPQACKHVYRNDKLAPFELTRTLFVHAAMKMGKTKALREYINTHFVDGLKTHRVVIVSFRQTFSGNLKEKFPDYTVYSDVVGPLSQDKLIVQVESLYRMEIREGMAPPDLLILDECESIFEQFDSGLLRGHFNTCFSKFQYLMRHSQHVVFMDAGMSDRTYRMVEQMRPWTAAGQQDDVQPIPPCIYHHNTYQNATEDKYYFTGEKLKWLGILYASIDADERVAVPMSSLAEAKILHGNLLKKYPQKRIRLYSSETSPSEKREHFADVHAYWGDTDVLIYTPTVSAGVSFELAHFSKVFGYFTDQSCGVETCIQMIGRIRDVGDKTLFICLQARGNTLPVTIDALRMQVMNNRANLYAQFDDTHLRVEYNANGEAQYHTGDYFQLWLENTRMRNLSKNSFVRLMLHQLHMGGSQLQWLSEDVFKEYTGNPVMVGEELNADLMCIQMEHCATKEELAAHDIQQIVAAEDITADDAESIRGDMIAGNDITPETRAQFDRYRLRGWYNYQHDIDEKFVRKYHDPKVRNVYRNISKITGHATIADALSSIQKEECAIHSYLMDRDMAGDLNRRYVFDRHRYALGLLQRCGWTSVDDPVYLNAIQIVHNLMADDDGRLFWDTIEQALGDFGMKPHKRIVITRDPDKAEAECDYLLKPVNKIISAMYGISAGTRKMHPGMFVLNKCSLFTQDPEISAARHIPLINGAGFV